MIRVWTIVLLLIGNKCYFYIFCKLLILNIVGLLCTPTSTSSKWILELGDNFLDVRKDGGYWLVNFYTPWCGQCKRLEPIWAHVVQALKNTHIRVGRVDCTTFPHIAKLFQVYSYPTIKL